LAKFHAGLMLAAMELTDPPAVEAPARARGSADYERVARAIGGELRADEQEAAANVLGAIGDVPGLHCVEQPVPSTDLLGLRRLR